MNNLEYINSLPCSQRLKDRIIEENKKRNLNWGLDNDDYLSRFSMLRLDALFPFDETIEGHDYWFAIHQSIRNNTPIVE